MDDLERMIRAARPEGVGRHEPLSERARADLAAMLSEPLPAPATRRASFSLPAWSAFAVAAAAVVTVIVLVVGNVMTPAPSFAATPPLLQVEAGDEEASALLADLATDLRAGESETPGGREETIEVQMWGLVTNPDGDLPTFVSPEHHEIARHPDGGFDQVVTAGAPFDALGRPVDSPDLPAPGTELWSIHELPGEHFFTFPDALPPSGDELKAFIADIAGLTDASPASDWLAMVTGGLLLERQLTAHEEASVLDLLATLDLDHAGTTTDRLGREALVFETAPSPADFVERILVSPDGHILAAETLYVGHDRTDIPSPAVVSYFAWERT